jgi:hypothetical protein
VRQKPIGDEVVGVLDVDVVGGSRQLRPLHRLDTLVRPVLGEHDHVGPYRAGGHEGERARAELSHLLNRDRARGRNLVHDGERLPVSLDSSQ